MRNTILICLMFTALWSCKPQKHITAETKVTQRDSVATRTEAVDTMIVARPADLAKLSEDIAKLEGTGVTSQSGAATLTVRRTGDKVEATCECAELKEAVEVYKQIVEHYRQTETTTTQSPDDKFKIKDILIYLLWIAAIWKGGDIVLQLIKTKND
ncbi:hypothetical protein Q4603_05695 [Zobellia galactanivorans]|uniref:hypothetical protein n=1 Tax=Zobellia galactanivorans (strain DSM 12802 / CCUG 47099 / CIP 106680 / NCIMB 13871 / Dsij) TaxID=63186 RepID=UPI0026E17394|nr:hypothetical protein [Zobellia galactanivorans]MDO6808088.1 hypothetical protein [Zobellia galactanivorans]